MNEIREFLTPFEHKPVRMVMIDGQPWFVAKDVAARLGYSEESLATVNKIVACVPEEWRGRKPIPTLGGPQDMAILSEQGLYFFLARSDKPAALPFQKWIAGEVLPSIRKTGAYFIPTTLADALQLAADLARENDQKTALLEAQAPDVAYARAIDATGDATPLGDFAHNLASKGWPIGRQRLFDLLEKHNVLYKEFLPTLKKHVPKPYQDQIQAERFRVNFIPVPYKDALSPQVLITPKGQRWVLDHFEEWGIEKKSAGKKSAKAQA
jgi:prophage antirepressor-like protein